MQDYDVIVAGGSVSGLFAAREIALSGFKVCVLEEDHEIGTPEHCGGVISMTGLNELRILPSIKSTFSYIEDAEISSLNNSFTVSAKKQKVLVIDRREFDKQIAYQAQKNGADIRTMNRVVSINTNKNLPQKVSQNADNDNKSNFIIKTNEGIFTSKFFIDARGISSLIQKNRKGVMSSAQYEVYSKDFESNKISIKFDSIRYPGFFAWIIPMGQGKAKVGVAGHLINTVPAIKGYLDELCISYSIIRKIFAPVWIGGPIPKFIINNNYIIVGDAAGQTKPTTAGGIFSCGMGGIFAGSSISQYLNGNKEKLFDYEKNWFSKFGSEFEKMLIFRKLIERLDNKAMDKIFDTISKSNIEDISNTTDFDFHSSAISKILGIKGTAKILNAIVGNEFRRIF